MVSIIPIWWHHPIFQVKYCRINNMARVGDIKTFDNFVVSVPAGIDTSKYSAVIIWCERFSQFITAASYK
jgi:hypothetical protein